MFYSRLICLCLLFFVSHSSAASVRASGLVLREYPDARVVFRTQEQAVEYRLALGSFRKSDGTWQANREQKLRGELTRITQELPANHTAQAGFEFYLEQLKQLDRRELFSCSARDCGPSNTWANNHFKIIQLYGLDQYQFYGAYEVKTESPNPYYVSIYTVRRGNKRVYAQVDILHSDKERTGSVAANPDTVIRLLQNDGYYVFPDPIADDADGRPRLKIDAANLRTLVAVLERQSGWRVSLVGHDYHAANLAGQQRQSLAYAEQLQSALISAGIDVDRLLVSGLGSLAPAGRGDFSARVEVVLLP